MRGAPLPASPQKVTGFFNDGAAPGLFVVPVGLVGLVGIGPGRGRAPPTLVPVVPNGFAVGMPGTGVVADAFTAGGAEAAGAAEALVVAESLGMASTVGAADTSADGAGTGSTAAAVVSAVAAGAVVATPVDGAADPALSGLITYTPATTAATSSAPTTPTAMARPFERLPPPVVRPPAPATESPRAGCEADMPATL